MNSAPKIYKMRIRFIVADAWDHKRIFAALRDMVLQSALPFEPAKVNKNWPRLAYGPALGYKQYSSGELADLYFTQSLQETAVQDALVKSAPDGVRVLQVRRVPYALPSVSNLAEVMKYSVQGDFSSYAPARSAVEFFSGKHIYITQQTSGAISLQQDIKPFVLSVAAPEANKLELLLTRQGDKTIKPEYVVAAWLGVPVEAEAAFTLPNIKFTREALYWRNSEGKLCAL